MTAAAPAGVAVVVPVRDDPVRLARCLAALAAQTVPPAEVVVVDDGSRQPPDVAPPARLVRQANAGSYAARNRGVAATTSPVVAFTDADCLPAPDWLERGLEALEQAPHVAGVVAGAVEVFGRGPHLGTVERYDALTAFPQEQFVARWGFGVTADLLVRREVLEQVGPFDERLRSGGDADWGERAAALGFRAVYVPAVQVRHPARARLAELVEKSRRTARGVEDLGRVRQEVTPLVEAVRRHLASPADRLTVARAAGVRGPALVGFGAVAVLAGLLGAGEVLRCRVAHVVQGVGGRGLPLAGGRRHDSRPSLAGWSRRSGP